MAELVTKQDIARYRNMINERGVCGARDVYKELKEKGHGYAGWAYGISSGKTITGQAALNLCSKLRLAKQGNESLIIRLQIFVWIWHMPILML